MIDGTNPEKPESSTYDPTTNAHLKGRKRFNADLAQLREASNNGLILSGLKLKSVCFIVTCCELCREVY